MEDLRDLDALTIEEYMYNSTVLSAGLCRKSSEENAYISLIRDMRKIPFVMKAVQKDSKAAETLLNIRLSLVQNVLVIYAPAFEGVSLQRYARTQQPYGSFDIAEKILAELTKYEKLNLAVFIQLLMAGKVFVDSNAMPHVQFWIDDLNLFEEQDTTALVEIRNRRLSQLMLSTFSDDFIPDQMKAFADQIDQGKYETMLQMLEGLDVYRTKYYDTDSERRGEIVVKAIWLKLQKHMLLIALVLIALVYGYYWFFYAKSDASATVYKSGIGDVVFVLPNDQAAGPAESQKYVLDFGISTNSVTVQKDEVPLRPEVKENEKTVNVIISAGDTLYRICETYYGDGNYYEALAEFNGISNPNLIPVGINLSVPPLSELLESQQQ